MYTWGSHLHIFEQVNTSRHILGSIPSRQSELFDKERDYRAAQIVDIHHYFSSLGMREAL